MTDADNQFCSWPARLKVRARRLMLLITISFAVLCPGSAFPKPESRGIELLAKPARCVALHEGQDCYLNLTLSWHGNEPGNYCLYEKGNEKALQCWKNARSGKFEVDFKSSKSVVYLLRNEIVGRPPVEVSVTVSWVYSSNTRKTNWRLF
jgi:hypothetical protein